MMSAPVNQQERVTCPNCLVLLSTVEFSLDGTICDTCFTEIKNDLETAAEQERAQLPTCLYCPAKVTEWGDFKMCDDCHNERHCEECCDQYEPTDMVNGMCHECIDYDYQCNLCGQDFNSYEEKKQRKHCPDCEAALNEPEDIQPELNAMCDAVNEYTASVAAGYASDSSSEQDWNRDKPVEFCYKCFNANDIDQDEPNHVCPHTTTVTVSCVECLITDHVVLSHGIDEMIYTHICQSCVDMKKQQEIKRNEFEARLRAQISISKTVLKPKLLDRKPKVIKRKPKSKYAMKAIVIQ